MPVALIGQNYNACVENQSMHIVVLGSSTAAGAGPSSIDSAWVNRYRKHLQSINPLNQVTNLGVGGTTTYNIMPDWFSDTTRPARNTTKNISQAVRLGADAVIINMPSNDASRGYVASEQLFNFRTIKSVADSFNIKLWVCTTQPRSFSAAKKLIQLEVKDSVLTQYGANAIDFWNGIADSNNDIKAIYNSGDNVHLNGLAHRELNQRVINELIPNHLIDTLLHPDFSIRLSIPETKCGDSAEQISAVVSNLGPTSLSAISINIEINNNGQVNTNTIVIPANLNSCSSDTVLQPLNSYSGGSFQVRAYLNSADTIASNDTSLLHAFSRLGIPSISSGNTNHCPTDSATFLASSNSNNKVVWYDSIHSTVPSNIGNSYSVLPSGNQTDLFVEAVAGPLHFNEVFDLTRTLTTNWNGHMFDIIPNDTLILDSLEIPINSLGNQKVEAYYRIGSHKNHEGNSASWTYWGIDSAQVGTARELVSINYSDLQLLPSDTFAVYLHLQNPNSTLSYQNSSAKVYSNPKLSVTSGSGVSNTFGAVYYPRNFSGKLHYHYGFNPNGTCQSPRIKVSSFQVQASLNIGNDTTILLNDSLVLTANGFTHLNWSTGDTSNQITVLGSSLGLGNHNISLEARDAFSCLNRDTIIVSVSGATNLLTNNVEDIRIVPNPTSGRLKVLGDFPLMDTYQIYSPQGALLSEAKLNLQGIDLSSFQNGVYLIVIRTKEGFFTERVVLNK